MVDKRTEIIKKLIEMGFLISPDFLDLIDEKFDVDKFVSKLKLLNEDVKVLTKEIYYKVFREKVVTVNKKRGEIGSRNSKIKVGEVNLLYFIKKVERKENKEYIYEREIRHEEKIVIKKKEVSVIESKKRRVGEEYDLKVKILKNYSEPYESITVGTWASYFRARYKKISKFVKMHQEVSMPISIKNLSKYSEEVTVLGLVYEKTITSNGNIKLVLEDPTGYARVIVKKDSEIYERALMITPDTVIGVKGTFKNGVLFPTELYFPDIPIVQKKNYNEDIYIAFTGDMQIGSKHFLKKNWEKFILWLKGKYGTEKQREIARKVGYLVITGDLVDGVGVYPNQEEELEIKDIYAQYELVEKYLMEIPEDIKVVIIPGNHDNVVRLAEPQPPIPKQYLPNLYKLDNFFLLSNPSYFYLHKTPDFPGFLVLAYHGYSFDWLVSNVSYIRNNGGYDNPPIIMKYLLMFRHLAPTHGSSPYVPFSDKDPLIIDPVPDIFVTGHIHRTAVGNYKGVDLINASCWQGPTPYQIEMGHVPDSSKVVLKNIKTGKYTVLKFDGG